MKPDQYSIPNLKIMKSKLILFLAMLLTSVMNAQIVAIPDASFKAKLIALGVDTNTDGEIQQNEALLPTALDVSNSGISDLTGIEYFTNLNHLECHDNLLLNLNLTGLSYLQVLDCSNNQLSTLNLTGVQNLAMLVCSNNLLTSLNGVASTTAVLRCNSNRLTSINANSLTNLSELDCSNNKITSLNIAGAANLTTLLCASNLLTTLDVNGFTNLNMLDCSANKLTQLNVSNLALLTAIYCRTNETLTTVNLNNLSSLTNIDLIGVDDTNNGFNVTGNLSSLTLTNLPQIWNINCSYNKLATLDLNNLSNLRYLNCSFNQLTNLSLVNLPNLIDLTCYVNKMQSLDVTNLHGLVTLRCGGGYRLNNQLTDVLQTLNVAGLSNLDTFECFDTLITSLDLTGLTNLTSFYFSGIDNAGVLSSLDISGSTNLKYLRCMNTALTTLDVSNLPHLETLECWRGHITNLNLNGLLQLKTLNYSFNYITNLSLTNLPLLESFDCSSNLLTELNVSDLTSLKTLYCAFNQLTTLNLTGLSSLVNLNFSNNNVTLANINGISPNLISLGCESNNLTSLDVTGFPALEILYCKQNQLTALDLSTSNNLKYLNCDSNQISNLNVSNLSQLEKLECSYNQLTTINTSNLTQLTVLQCTNNQINALNLTNNPLLEILSYSNNPLPNFSVNHLINLKGLSCFDTQTSSLDVSNLTKLQFLYCDNNQLQTLDVGNCVALDYLSCTNNLLTTLFVKNGKNESTIDLVNNPNLQYICADTDQLYTLQTYINSLGMNATVANSYCTFTPGGNYNTITGTTIFDEDNNGCDITDEVNPFIRLDIHDGTTTGSTMTNIDGGYSYYTDAGTYTINPNVENPTWFDFSPPTANFTFADNNNNLSTQDFCIQAVGVHNDVEVVLIPIDFARPGFNATYKIVYKNKGNQMHSGAVSLHFDDSRIDFVSAVPATSAASLNNLTWNFVNLMPFENRSVLVTLNVNAPTETPSVNIGDILNFTASITPVVVDELPLDNTFSYNQIVVGAYDPNDITCLEGDTVNASEIGAYLHYVVNFENTGNAAAENVVVKLDINPAEFDISSLQLMNTSHEVKAQIKDNVIEFKFANINLAPRAGDPPVGGHGSILFKMKSQSSLNVGSIVTNKAGIYFDYNFPVETNDADTTFATLNNTGFTKDNSVIVYPNPSNDFIQVKADTNIKQIELFDIQGRILETLTQNENAVKFNISNKTNGIYFLRITTQKGTKIEKIVKK